MPLPPKDAAIALLHQHVRDDFVPGSARWAPSPITLRFTPGHA